jgi:hypothetical protein
LASLFFLPVLPRLSLHSKGYKGNNNSRLWKLTDRNDVKHTRQCQFDVDDLDIGNGGVAGEVEHRLASQLKKGKKGPKMEYAGDVGEKKSSAPSFTKPLSCLVIFMSVFWTMQHPRKTSAFAWLSQFVRYTHTLRPTRSGFVRLSSSSPSHASPPPKLTTLTTNNDIHRNRFPCWVQLVIFYDSFLIYSFSPLFSSFSGIYFPIMVF